jgi:prevent-host-death family protein
MRAMDETITAAEANRSFSRLLRGVQQGQSYLVTSHGRPVARVVPPDQDDEMTLRLRGAARRVLLERVAQQPTINIGRWTRAELYER